MKEKLFSFLFGIYEVCAVCETESFQDAKFWNYKLYEFMTKTLIIESQKITRNEIMSNFFRYSKSQSLRWHIQGKRWEERYKEKIKCLEKAKDSNLRLEYNAIVSGHKLFSVPNVKIRSLIKYNSLTNILKAALFNHSYCHFITKKDYTFITTFIVVI